MISKACIAGAYQRKLEEIAARGVVARHPVRDREPGGRKGNQGRRVSVTVSIGAAERSDGQPPAQVLRAADQALYRAKQAGRNRVSR